MFLFHQCLSDCYEITFAIKLTAFVEIISVCTAEVCNMDFY